MVLTDVALYLEIYTLDPTMPFTLHRFSQIFQNPRCVGVCLTALGVVFAAGASAAVVRGSLIDPPVVLDTLTAGKIDAATSSAGIQTITGKARCDVKVVSLHYQTVGTAGEDANASGVMLVPAGNCAQSGVLVAYAKGSDVEKLHTLASPTDSQTLGLAAFFATHGYTVVATDYLGFAKSNYPYHPYLHADSEASSVIDSVRAARYAAAAVGANLSGKVMFTGYSQGGHASMAAHRAAERDNAAEISVLGGAHLAGPYNLSGSLTSGSNFVGAQIVTPYFITAWQKVYGGMYGNAADVFQAPYASTIETLLPSATFTIGSLLSSGTLPGANNETPNQALNLLLKPAFRADMQTNPNNAVFLAAKKNDLMDWSPIAKVLLCGGSADPTVLPSIHQAPMKAAFDSRGLTNVTSVDVDFNIRSVFAAVLLFSPATYYANYHGTIEPAFCLAQAKTFLDALVAASAGALADAETVFNWAEKNFALVFSPGATSGSIGGYRFRQYGLHYLAVNESGTPHLYYLGPLNNNTVLDLGPLSVFVQMAR